MNIIFFLNHFVGDRCVFSIQVHGLRKACLHMELWGGERLHRACCGGYACNSLPRSRKAALAEVRLKSHARGRGGGQARRRRARQSVSQVSCFNVNKSKGHSRNMVLLNTEVPLVKFCQNDALSGSLSLKLCYSITETC